MLSSSRNQQLYPAGIFPCHISYTMKKNWKTQKQMADSFWCFTTAELLLQKKRIFLVRVLWLPFVITQAERRTRGILGSAGRGFSPVCLWGDYNLHEASLKPYLHRASTAAFTLGVVWSHFQAQHQSHFAWPYQLKSMFFESVNADTRCEQSLKAWFRSLSLWLSSERQFLLGEQSVSKLIVFKFGQFTI